MNIHSVKESGQLLSDMQLGVQYTLVIKEQTMVCIL